ncbi:MAG: TMEM175 family protein [Rhizobiaceae bacterium]
MTPPDFIPRHRIDALVDAVLAITMTLLVLELRVPEVMQGDIFGAISELTPQIVAWVVSFLILAVCWHGHVVNFRAIEHIDARLFWLVTLWLLVTSVIPFSSSLIGVHNELAQSHIVYAINIIAIQAAVVLRNLYLRRHPGLFRDGTAEGHPIGWMRALAVSLAAAASVAVACYWTTDYASVAYLAIGPIGAILRRINPRKGEISP